MLTRFFGLFDIRKKTGAATVSNFNFDAGKPLVANTWGEWLECQPAPLFKPNHRLFRCSHYIYGVLDYQMAVTQHDKWGYALYVGYAQADRFIGDSQLANPTTDIGKLIKLAASNPSKYIAAGAIRQKYPEVAEAPTGHLTYEDGSRGSWSPEAPPAAMQIAEDFKLEPLKQLAALGIKFGPIYDGGEEGINVVTANPEVRYGRDAAVLAAKGSRTWNDYISDKSSAMLKRFRDAVAAVAPTKQVYVYYPTAANPYANIPDVEASTLMYSYMKDRASDMPSGSIYYRDQFAGDGGFGNPFKIDRNYQDQITHWIAAIGEQLAYNQPYSYNFVSSGWKRYRAGGEDPWFVGNISYRGFLKCLYALGMVGGVAGYFSPDAANETILGVNDYPAYDPVNPPSWLIQMQTLGEVHAVFSWLDDYILDGDLLPGVGQNIIKTYLPSYEYPCRVYKGAVLSRDKTIRCFVRKKRNEDKWLVVVWAAERLDGLDGSAKNVIVDEIPGLPSIRLLARPQGSVYTVSLSSGKTTIVLQDPPTPNVAHTPVLVGTKARGQLVTMIFYAPRGLDASNPPPASAFSVNGIAPTSVEIVPKTIQHNTLKIQFANPLPSGNATLSYNGQGLVDTDTNLVAAFSRSIVISIDDFYFTTLAAGIVFNEGVYTCAANADWLTSTMVSTISLVGDGEVSAELGGSGSMIALSTESTNTGDYRTWAYAVNTGGATKAVYAWQSGTLITLLTGETQFNFTNGGRVKLARSGGTVEVFAKPTGDTNYTKLGTYSTTNTQRLYLHGAFGAVGSSISDVTVTGFA